ncbi:unnamed protein product [Ixodes pacificus]
MECGRVSPLTRRLAYWDRSSLRRLQGCCETKYGGWLGKTQASSRRRGQRSLQKSRGGGVFQCSSVSSEISGASAIDPGVVKAPAFTERALQPSPTRPPANRSVVNPASLLASCFPGRETPRNFAT